MFAGCNLFAVFFVYFFLPETSGRSLEEIDTMFLLEVKPWKSSHWKPTKGEELITADKLRLNSGARDITKRQEGGGAETEEQETIRSHGRNDLPQDGNVSGTREYLGAGARGNSVAGAQ